MPEPRLRPGGGGDQVRQVRRGRAGAKKGNVDKFQFWQHHNKPIELWSEKTIKQKIDYIHNNPVESGFVTEATHWKYSSARNFQEDNTVLEVDEAGFLGY